MCGRFVFWEDEPDDEFQKIVYELHETHPEWSAGEEGVIRPSQQAPVLLPGLKPQLFQWGYPGYEGSKLLINARAETARMRRTFQESFYRRRCLIVSTGFFEWSAERRPFLFRPVGGGALYMAALYEKSSEGERFVILTTAATSQAGKIHSRMPLLVDETQRQSWLENTAFAARHLEAAMPQLEIRAY